MLTEETIKKLWLWGMVAVLVVGLFWLVFVFLFNRGSIKIEAEPSYMAEISGVRSESCAENPCVLEVAPGEYTLRLSKEGYLDSVQNVSVPLGGEAVISVEFIYRPVMTVLGEEDELGYFADEIAPETFEEELPENFAAEEGYVAYIDRNPENGRQTLYYREIASAAESAESEGSAQKTLGGAKIATSFMRDLKSWKIYPSIEDGLKIAVVEQTDQKSALYLVDLAAKTRDNILEMALIDDLKWLHGTGGFLYYGREFGTSEMGLYFLNPENGDSVIVDLDALPENIGYLGANRLFAATNGSPADFVEYSLETGLFTTLLADTTPGNVEKIKISSDGRSAYVLKQGTVYQVRFGL